CTPEVQATGRCERASGKAVYQATQSSAPQALTSPGPLEVFGPLQSSGRAQILITPPPRSATATARPPTLTDVRDGFPWASRGRPARGVRPLAVLGAGPDLDHAAAPVGDRDRPPVDAHRRPRRVPRGVARQVAALLDQRPGVDLRDRALAAVGDPDVAEVGGAA